MNEDPYLLDDLKASIYALVKQELLLELQLKKRHGEVWPTGNEPDSIELWLGDECVSSVVLD